MNCSSHQRWNNIEEKVIPWRALCILLKNPCRDSLITWKKWIRWKGPRNFKHVKQLLLKFRKLGQLPPVKKRQLSLSLLAKFYAAQVLISQLRLGSRSSRRVVAPSFPGLELRTWTARVLSELEGWLRRHSPLTTSGAGGPRPFCKITTQRINLLRLIQHFKKPQSQVWS